MNKPKTPAEKRVDQCFHLIGLIHAAFKVVKNSVTQDEDEFAAAAVLHCAGNAAENLWSDLNEDAQRNAAAP